MVASERYHEIVDILLEAGVIIPDTPNRSPVIAAAQKRHWKIVRLFLEKGVDLDPIRRELESHLSKCKDEELLAMIKI